MYYFSFFRKFVISYLKLLTIANKMQPKPNQLIDSIQICTLYYFISYYFIFINLNIIAHTLNVGDVPNCF